MNALPRDSRLTPPAAPDAPEPHAAAADDALAARLRSAAPPALADDGFSARVQARLAALPRPVPAGWLSPEEALRRVELAGWHRRLRLRWRRLGLAAGAALAAGTWLATGPGVVSAGPGAGEPLAATGALAWMAVSAALAMSLAAGWAGD